MINFHTYKVTFVDREKAVRLTTLEQRLNAENLRMGTGETSVPPTLPSPPPLSPSSSSGTETTPSLQSCSLAQSRTSQPQLPGFFHGIRRPKLLTGTPVGRSSMAYSAQDKGCRAIYFTHTRTHGSTLHVVTSSSTLLVNKHSIYLYHRTPYVIAICYVMAYGQTSVLHAPRNDFSHHVIISFRH